MSDEHNNDNLNDNLNDDNDFFRFSMDPENKKNGNNKNGGKRKRKFPIFTLLLFIFLGLLIVDLFQSKKQDNEIDFSDFNFSSKAVNAISKASYLIIATLLPTETPPIKSVIIHSITCIALSVVKFIHHLCYINLQISHFLTD